MPRRQSRVCPVLHLACTRVARWCAYASIITVHPLALSLLFARGFRCILAREDRAVTENPVWVEVG